MAPGSGTVPWVVARVLVLDDDVEIARMVARVVELLGHTPLVETSSVEAVIKHGRTGLDAAIVDLMMPRLDGLEVLAQLQESQPATRRILLTAAPTERSVRDALTSGLVQLLVAKPPTLSDLQLALAWLPVG